MCVRPVVLHRILPLPTVTGVDRILQHAPDEANSIEPIAKPFMQDPGEWTLLSKASF